MLPFSLDTMNMMAMTDNICITNDYVGISSEFKKNDFPKKANI